VTAVRQVLRPGDWVQYGGGEHQVVALSGTSVRLRSAAGAESVVLASYLVASPGFEVSGGDRLPGVEPAGLLDGLPPEAVAAARELEAHVVEAVTGFPPGTVPGIAARPGYDPSATTQLQRDGAKAAELGIGVRTVQEYRARYARQGLLGLVDRRVLRGRTVTGRCDARLVAAVREALDAETGNSTGTRARLMRRVVKDLAGTYGPGVVPVPGRTVFYELVDALSAGRHTFGSAVTRRQLANRPAGPFTPTLAARPGEQVQVDSTPLDVMVLADAGVTVRADLTIAVDVATRTIGAAVLRPVGTKAVDAALLLARMLVPEPMRPGWAESLRMSASVLPHARLAAIDERMELAAARPVIVPDTIVIDGGRVFISETFTRACARLGVTVQRSRPRTPTDKSVVEATFGSVNSLLCQHLAGYTGRNPDRRGDRVEAQAAWTVPDLQELLDEWIIAGWQSRPHDALRDPCFPRRAVSPNEKYAALVAAAGYLAVPLTGADYLELLPVTWRVINDYGIRIDYRTYDHADLAPWRRQHSGITARKGLWEVHYDPYDVSRVFVRTPGGWVTAGWTHLPMVSAPFADFTWRHARRLAAARGLDPADQAAVARVLDDLLTRAQAGPDARTSARVAARTAIAAAGRPALPPARDKQDTDHGDTGSAPAAQRAVAPMGIFDAYAEAEKWR
jgi:putative transposase